MIIRNYYIMFVISIGVLTLLFGYPSISSANIELEKQNILSVPKKLLKSDPSKSAEVIHWIHENHTLSGLIDESHFYYEIPNETAEKDSYLQLNIAYSNLLLPESTITVSIDEQPVESYSIDPDQTVMELKIPLTEEMLTTGFHQLTISFYGHITEGLCPNEENPGNWLTILPSSYLNIQNTAELVKENVLTYYPYPFVHTSSEEQIKGTIVIPKEPSKSNLLSAAMLASYLVNITDEGFYPIVQEDQLEIIDSHLIVIGAVDQWESIIKDLIDVADIDVSENKFVAHNYFLQTDDSDKQLLLLTAKDDTTILDFIPLFTENDFIEQLSGNDLQMEHLPEVSTDAQKTRLTFKDLDIPEQTITGKSNLSQVYFYRLSRVMNQADKATLNLRLNFSKTLLSEIDKDLLRDDQTELVVYLNGIPHSVPLDQFTEEADKNYHQIQIEIEPTYLKNERYLTLQFAGHGLRDHDICVLPNDDKWIFLHEDSYLDFSYTGDSLTTDFGPWPEPFSANGFSETALVIPEKTTKHMVDQVLLFLAHLGTNEHINSLDILLDGDLTNEILQNKHLVFLGHYEHFPTLEKQLDQLKLTQNEQHSWDVTPFQFVQEVAESVAWIQQSPWNEQHLLAIFTPINQESDQWVNEPLLQFLEQNNDSIDIIVSHVSGEVFTHRPLETVNDDQDTTETSEISTEVTKNIQEIPLWIIISFISIVLVTMLFILLLIRRARRS